ncbi:hypothetical protein KZ483_04325 [Paenibacillus sp. sptzw28]|uniref:hypothetical protein n=1 Tax=Paenibacillus sp. sptzw28 TaxID=715179 RepID=UPI001C6E8FED|nr:hypothetical protein [Paenibacillus sp. sptzw28]QYR22231.1 hypothetical protein KZ483_04325 [Paenibacillus sp. sptzw28]
MKKFIVPMLFLSLALILGCQEQSDVTKTTPAPSVNEGQTQVDQNKEQTQVDQNQEQSQVEEFSIKANGEIIALHDLDTEVNLEQVLGKPLSQDIEEVKGDTLTGSFLKKLTYDGLEMELFSPKGDGKTYWIMTMSVSKKGYATSKGVELGNTVQEMKDAYPGIKIAEDGRTDPNNCAYEISNQLKYDYLVFEVKDGVVSQIKLFNKIP